MYVRSLTVVEDEIPADMRAEAQERRQIMIGEPVKVVMLTCEWIIADKLKKQRKEKRIAGNE